MTTIRVLLTALAVAIALSAFGRISIASCIQQTVAEQAARADAVAYGRVTRLEGPQGRLAHLDIERVLKGSVPARIAVALGPGAESGAGAAPVATSIDYLVQRGEDHTLYLKQTAPSAFATDACSGSHRGGPTAEETAMFGPGRAPDPAPSGTAAGGADPAVAAVATGLALAAGLAAILYLRRRSRPSAA